MIRHILFWKYTDTVKAEHREAEALAFLQKSVATMVGHIDGLRCAEINTNTAGGEYDLVFYSELRDADHQHQSHTDLPSARRWPGRVPHNHPQNRSGHPRNSHDG